ncbi:MAG: aminotransferase class V-fold PLP-dependent enzyme [Paracoccaceae bacterium]
MFEFGEEEVQAAAQVMRQGRLFRYLEGYESETAKFEQSWSDLIGVKHSILVNSGTSALITALRGVDLMPGDEVIIPAYTFVATAVAIISLGAVPIVANIDRSLTIEPSDIASRITERTRAIVAVHMCGYPCDMHAILAVARQNDLAVIEDACQAAGGTYRGARLGSLGDAAAFSFNYFKTISSGEGGVVVTSHEKVFERALIYHDSGCALFGRNGRLLTMPVFSGQNYRLSEICSAVLNVQIGRLDDILGNLRLNKAKINELGPWYNMKSSPCHDELGECGTTLSWICKDYSYAKRMVDILTNAGFDCGIPFDDDRHVYTHWRPMWENEISISTRILENEQNLSLEPSINILKSTVQIFNGTNWTDERLHSLNEIREQCGT